MSIAGQLSKTPGIPRITEIFLATLTQRQQPTADVKDGNCQPAPKLPPHFRQLQQQMEENTERCLWQDTYHTMRRIFSISELQFRTLSEIGVSEPDLQTLQALNFLLPHHANYAVNQRLKVVATAPPAPPDWQNWWFQYRESFIGIHRPQDHDPAKDPASENLNRIIAVLAAAALPHLPTIGQIYDRMATEANRAGKAVRISDVYTCASQLIHWGEGIGIPAEATGYQDLSPESIASVLQESGVCCETDMGTIGTVAELKQILPSPDLNDISTSATARLWWARESGSYWIPMAGRKNYTRYTRTKPDPEAELSEAEYRLIDMTTPEHPLSNEHYFTPNPVAATIGWLNRMTPQQVLAVLSDRPAPPEPVVCPQAAECQSWCGHLQATGEYPFPLTDDGNYQNCAYWQFLSRNAGQDLVSRELAAQQAISKWVQRQSREERKDPAPKPDTGPNQASGADAPPAANTQAALL